MNIYSYRKWPAVCVVLMLMICNAPAPETGDEQEPAEAGREAPVRVPAPRRITIDPFEGNVAVHERAEEPDDRETATSEDQPDILPSTHPVGERMVGLKYDEWALDEVLKDYSNWTGLALMKSPKLPSPTITLICPQRLPLKEALLAIEGILAMNGIALVPMGEKFVKVVPIETARLEGMPISVGEIRPKVADTDHLVSQIVMLKHIDATEAQNMIQNMMHPYGKIMQLERVNSLLITETAVNIKRILEILQYIDQPVESREELRIFRIAYAKASEIMSRIQAIIAEAETREDPRTDMIRRQLAAARRIARQARPDQPVPSPLPVREQDTPEERGLIHARVRMVADDRTGSLIVITRPEQFEFLERIITELDRQVDPDVTIKVFRLQYAKADDVVSVLNSLITSGAETAVRRPTRGLEDGREPVIPAEEAEILGRLSQDVKIISDVRINALLVMANRADMAVIEDVMSRLDIMLSQVLIEVIIVEIGLTDNFQSGVDWLQRSMIAYNEKTGGGRRAFMGFSGVSRVGTSAEIRDGSGMRRISDSTAGSGSGLSYYFTFFDYNLDVVLNMLAHNSQARLLSTPIILTTDNKEARIMVGEKRPIVTSTSITTGGTQQSAYQYTDIGIELKVTPHINKLGFVVMDIHQSVDNVGGYEVIDGNKVPIIVTREFSASLSVDDGRTIVVGGLMSSDKDKTSSRIPLLGDIPFLGRLFRSDSDSQSRRELLVMLTPYVLDTPQKVYEATLRRHDAVDESESLMIDSWVESELLDSSPKDGTGEVLEELDE